MWTSSEFWDNFCKFICCLYQKTSRAMNQMYLTIWRLRWKIKPNFCKNMFFHWKACNFSNNTPNFDNPKNATSEDSTHKSSSRTSRCKYLNRKWFHLGERVLPQLLRLSWIIFYYLWYFLLFLLPKINFLFLFLVTLPIQHSQTYIKSKVFVVFISRRKYFPLWVVH